MLYHTFDFLSTQKLIKRFCAQNSSFFLRFPPDSSGSILRFLVIIMDSLNSFTGQVRRCVDDYNMIEAGDAIAVGISGGKDSLILLAALRCLQRYYPKPFTLLGITIDAGFPDMDFTPVAAWCEEIGVPFITVKTDIREIVFDVRQEQNPCSLCSKLRKGALNNAALANGCNKVALGHHYDDAINTFFMSLIFEGRLSTFQPVTFLDRSGVTQIRPLLYAPESRIKGLVKTMELPVVKSTCPMDTDSKRREIQQLVADLQKQYPEVKKKAFGAIQRLPLPGWEKAEGRRDR